MTNTNQTETDFYFECQLDRRNRRLAREEQRRLDCIPKVVIIIPRDINDKEEEELWF